MDDHRRYERYEVQDTFAALKSDLTLGPVKDLSLGGVSFTCNPSVRLKHTKTVLQLFSKQKDFHLKHVPFKIISEIEIASPNPSSSFQMKRIGGSFYQLTERQKFKLKQFLVNFSNDGTRMNVKDFHDNGGRRSGIERRGFSFSIHFPERRSGMDRRSGLDRRTSCSERQLESERRRFFRT